MCGYLILVNACGCESIVFSPASCPYILHQLNRINQPEAWEPENLDKIPFSLPQGCEPGWHNTAWKITGEYCGRCDMSRPAATGTSMMNPNPEGPLKGPSNKKT